MIFNALSLWKFLENFTLDIFGALWALCIGKGGILFSFRLPHASPNFPNCFISLYFSNFRFLFFSWRL